MHHANTSMVRSNDSKLQTLLRTVLAFYDTGTLVRLVRTFKQRTNAPYPYFHNKSVLYNRTVLLSNNSRRIVPYLRTLLPCLIACRVLSEQLKMPLA